MRNNNKIELDKYYTSNEIAKYCVDKTFEILGSDWERIIEPSCGEGSFLSFLPESTLSYDIDPNSVAKTIIDYREVNLPFMERSLVIGNPPFGRANRLSSQFVKQSVTHSGFISFIQPISQLANNQLMTGTDLLYSEDLGETLYSDKPVKCCLNIYHRNPLASKKNYEVPGLIICRHIFRSGKCTHKDSVLNYNYDFRIGCWGTGRIRLLNDNEYFDNEIGVKVVSSSYEWFKKKLESINLETLAVYTTSPNLTVWRLRKYLYDEYNKEHYLFL